MGKERQLHKFVLLGLWIVGLLVSTNTGGTALQAAAASGEPAAAGLPEMAAPDAEQQAPAVQMALSAAHSTVSWDERQGDRARFELPLLYLHRERRAAAAGERTLEVRLSGLEGGREIEIELVSWHVDIASGDEHRRTERARLPDRPCTTDHPCSVRWTLDAGALLSDFYTLRVRDGAGQLLWQSEQPERPDLVVLDTWDVPIDAHVVRITYATLFPFARGPNDLHRRLAPGEVTDFVEHRFVPIIVDTWQTQFHKWEFGPVHPDWDVDGVVEIYVTTFPFALFGGIGTGTPLLYRDGEPYPERRVWWSADNTSFQTYDSLENAYKAIYAHEFFHLVQWNVLLSAGCPAIPWNNLFIEAQAKFAPSAQYPVSEIRGHYVVGPESEYGETARRFLAEGLNKSYRALEADPVHMYDAALYWRFLYEQAGGEMSVIRAALEEMACQNQPDIVTSIGGVMDAALVRTGGPLRSYEESLIRFAQANYALRLEGGRCATADLTQCENRHYDPKHTYPDPLLKIELDYRGVTLTYDGAIPSSYGMDFVEVAVDQGLADQTLHIALQSGGARLQVQVWRLGGTGERPRALTPQPEQMIEGENGLHTYPLAHLDPATLNSLALLITRLDADEGADVDGSYTLTLEPNL